MPALPRWTVAVILLGTGSATALADDRSEAVARQKAAAQAKLDAATLKLTLAETDDLLLYLPSAPERANAVAKAVQKAYETAAGALKYDAKDTPWTGKLTVFVVAGARPYKSFVLDALKRLPESNERTIMDLRGDAPFLVLGLDGEKPTDAQVAAEASRQVAATLLSRKAGVGRSAIAFGLPDWLRDGFGRAVHARSDGNGSRLSDHRQKVRALYNRTRGLAFQGAAVWGDRVHPQSDLGAASLAEYLAFGPAAEKFPALLAGFKPQDDNMPAPSIEAVLAGMEWKLEDLEVGWRKWVLTGK